MRVRLRVHMHGCARICVCVCVFAVHVYACMRTLVHFLVCIGVNVCIMSM